MTSLIARRASNALRVFLTPHQYEQYASFIDTLLVCVHTPWPLDIAVPAGGARLIGTEVARQIHANYLGRTAYVEMGASIQSVGLEEALESWNGLVSAGTIRYGIVVCDRVLEKSTTVVTAAHLTWLVVDWWQWCHERVEERRLAERLHVSLPCIRGLLHKRRAARTWNPSQYRPANGTGRASTLAISDGRLLAASSRIMG